MHGEPHCHFPPLRQRRRRWQDAKQKRTEKTTGGGATYLPQGENVFSRRNGANHLQNGSYWILVVTVI